MRRCVILGKKLLILTVFARNITLRDSKIQQFYSTASLAEITNQSS